MDKLDDLERKISEAKATSTIAPSKEKLRKADSKPNDKAGIQAGMEFAMCIGISTFFGYHIDQWAGTKPLFLILLFFLGVATGFWTLYKFSQKVNKASGYSQLPEAEKTANKAPERDSDT